MVLSPSSLSFLVSVHIVVKMVEDFHWFFASTCVSIIFTIVTYVISTMSTKLKSRRGSILRGYLASVIGTLCLLATLSLETILFGGIPVSFISIVVVSGVWYFWIASFFWINSMCLDISANFREFRYSMDVDSDESRRSKFSDYAGDLLGTVYAWGLAAMHTLLMIAWMVIWNSHHTLMRYLCLSVVVSPVIVVTTWNVYSLVSTALVIKKYEEEEAAHMSCCIDTYHQENKEWFMSCVKLFMITEMITILLIIALICNDSTSKTVISGLTALQGISIFMIFV